MIELEIETIAGRLAPAIGLHGRRGFAAAATRSMRPAGANRYKLAICLFRRCKMLRLLPAGADCAFRVRKFAITPLPLATFARRALRNGANHGEAPMRPRHLLRALRNGTAHGFAFESDGSALPKDQPLRPLYSGWIEACDYSETQRAGIAAEVASLAAKPLISVLMPVYNTPPDILDAAIASVVDQIYESWQLCIADDASTAPWIKPALAGWQARDSRIKVVHRTRNGHISAATNSAFALATGEFTALLDHDDLLRPHALAEVALAIARHPHAQVLYSDEDKIGADGNRYEPYFKPDWNYDLFLGQNYLNHLTVHRSANIRKVGGWRSAFDGSQDYDLNLRIAAALDGADIVHIPKILYHWRALEGSAARAAADKDYAPARARAAIAGHLRDAGIAASVEAAGATTYARIRRALPAEPPLVSVIVPTRNEAAILRRCIASIFTKTTYPNFELIVADNGSDDPETLAYFAELRALANVRVVAWPHPFNFSAINNFAVGAARGLVLCLLNNDTEVITPDWLGEMVSHALRPEVGCVGAMLYYPNDTIQHAGVVLGIGGIAGHSHKYFERGASGYFGRLHLTQAVAAVTAACLVVRKTVYEEAGGLDASNLPVAFNDVDFCLRLRERGYINIWTPLAELYHHESVSRGADSDPGNLARAAAERAYMRQRWGAGLDRDPYYSPHLTRRHEDFSIGGGPVPPVDTKPHRP